MSGFVYVLSNPCMPGMVKIGWTERHPANRARELQTTGVAEPFKIEFAFWSGWAAQIESMVHQALEAHRVAGNREFFQTEPFSAVFLIINTAVSLSTGECWKLQQMDDERGGQSNGR